MRNILIVVVLLISFAAIAQTTTHPTVNSVTQPVNGGTGLGLKNFYPALKNLQSATQGTKIVRVCIIGDSTSFGEGSSGVTTGSNQNWPALSFPTQLSNLLNNAGIKSHWNSFIGDGTNSVNYGNQDSRITLGSSWSQSTDFPSLGIDTFKATTNTNSLDFLPTTNVDTFKVFYIINSSNGIMSAQVGAGSVVTQDTSTGTNNSIGSFTVTGTLGANTVHLKWSSGAAVYLVGVEAWDSTQNWVSVINMGSPAATSGQWSSATNAYSPGNTAAYQAVGCNLIIDNLGINDYNTGVNVNTFTSNMQALYTAQMASGADIVSMVPVPTNTGNVAATTQYSFATAIRSLSNTNSLPLVDLALRWGSYASGANGNLYADTFTHPNAIGYSDNAQAIFSLIAPKNLPQVPLGGLNAPVSLVVQGTGSGGNPILNLSNTTSASYTQIQYQTMGEVYSAGAGGPTASFTNLRNSYFIFDQTAGDVDFLIKSNGNIGLGRSGTGGCNSVDTVGVCGNVLVTGYVYQTSAPGGNTNAYMETFATHTAQSTTSLNPGILVYGDQNVTNVYGLDLGYNATSTRFRDRMIASNSGDISFAFHSSGSAPTAQSSFTDRMTIRGDTGNVGIGTPSPSDLLDVSGALGITATTATAPLVGMYSPTANNLSLTTSGGVLALPNIGTDATHTDATVCEDTTTHALYAGSGTLGVCLGTSSARYKTGVKPIGLAFEKISQLKPVTFRYIKGRGDNGVKQQFGFLAEDMVVPFPQLVDLDAQGKPNSVDLVGLIPWMIEALQEQQSEIDGLKKQLVKHK